MQRQFQQFVTMASTYEQLVGPTLIDGGGGEVKTSEALGGKRYVM